MSLLKGPKTVSRSDKIDSFQATICEFGLAVPALYGRCKTAPNVINYQDFTSKEHSVTQKSGKAKSTQVSYLYSAYLELALGTPIESVKNIWVGNDKYDSLAALNAAGSSTPGQPLSVNLGNNSSPTAYMQEKHSDIAVGYQDLSYLYGYVFLGEDSASCPSYQVEVQGALGETGDGTDANPAYIIRDILEKLGLGAFIDETSFADYALYCKEADLLVSTPSGKFNEQRQAQEIVKELLSLTNAYMFMNGDKFVFIPKETAAQGDWSPKTAVVYDLDADDLAIENGGIVAFRRKDSNEIYNYVTVKFTNRSNDYEQESVSFQDVDDIRERGVKAVEIEALWLHTKERAIKFARAYARRCQMEINQYTLKLDWAFCRLTAGDLIRVTDENLGLDKQTMMVSEVSEDGYGLLTVTAVQRNIVTDPEPVYAIRDDYNRLDFNIMPSNTAQPVFIKPPADMTTSSSGLEVWIALRGLDEKWGGCQILVSDKDSNYSLAGVQDVSSSIGTITAMSSAATTVTVQFDNVGTVDILAGSVADADNGNTLLWIDGEIVAYESATLQARNKYVFDGLRRGLYGTKAISHTAGVKAVVIDSKLYSMPLPAQYNARELYFKFPAFNVLQKNIQEPADIMAYSTIVTTSEEKPNAPASASFTFTNEANLKWSAVTNTIVARYEVRSSASTANDSNLLYAGASTNAVINLTSRTGSVYIYAVNLAGEYSDVLKVDYSKAAPSAPAFTATAGLRNINLTYSNKPADCYAIKYTIVGASHSYEITTSDSTKLVAAEPDVYSVKACWLDAFGEGLINTKTVTVAIYIDPSLVAAESITEDKLNGVLQNKIITFGTDIAGLKNDIGALNGLDTLQSKVEEINGIVESLSNQDFSKYLLKSETNSYVNTVLASWGVLNSGKTQANFYTKTETASQITSALTSYTNNTLSSYSTITQLNNAIGLCVANTDYTGNTIMSKINLGNGTVKIDGKYIHITGDTVFDNNIIAKGMIQSKAVSADKLDVTSLSAISATIGTLRTKTSGARTEIKDNNISVYDANNVLRVEIGELTT